MQLRKGTLPLVGIAVLALITFAVVFVCVNVNRALPHSC